MTGVGEDAELQERLGALAELIASAPVNLVSRRERDHVADTHVPECLEVGKLLPGLRDGTRWMDLGTGGGLPGLVLALAYPAVEWVLVDSVRKKARMVQEFARALAAENVMVVCGRAETLGHEAEYRERFDGIVSRAVAPLVTLVELARGFACPGGWLGAIKGPGWDREIDGSRRACEALGWGDIHGERMPSAVRPTWLVTMRAVRPASGRFPRAPGVPQRRPLG